MTGRCRITELKKSYDNSKGAEGFPFTCDELAHMMKYMAVNIDDFEPYKPAFDIFEMKAQKSI